MRHGTDGVADVGPLGPPATVQGSDGDAAGLEATCEASAPDEATRALCLYVVHTLLIPGSGVSDQDGVTYDKALGCPEPCLGTDELGEGQT